MPWARPRLTAAEMEDLNRSPLPHYGHAAPVRREYRAAKRVLGRLAEQLPSRGDLPDAHRLVIGATLAIERTVTRRGGGQVGTVGRERQSVDEAVVARELAGLLPGGKIPEVDAIDITNRE